MKKRKIKKSRPMFKKKRSPAKTALNVILIILLLLGLAFLGYSVGKPIVEFAKGREPSNVETQTDPVLPPQTEPTEPTTAETTETETEPEPEPEPTKRILFVSMPAGGGYDGYIDERIEYAAENGFYGLAIELLADGGRVLYNTANPLALSYSAVAESGIADLKAVAEKISSAGLVPYARISALTDHIASWDKSVCYLFENSTSTWLDDSLANGGKPWISAFSQSAREYVAGFVTEISDAGFAGIISGELEFPPFRNSDLNYVGASVKSAERYNGLIGFSNALQSALGAAKLYAVEVDARDIIAGSAEILKDPQTLNCGAIYVKYDSAAVGERIARSDGTEVSYSGLSEGDKATVVFRSVAEELKDCGKTIIPAVCDESLIPTLVSMGYDEQTIVVY